MTWTVLSWSFGSILTSADMNNFYDNFAGLGNGDGAAPSIVKAALTDKIVTFADAIDNGVTDGSLNCSSSAWHNVPAGIVNLACTTGQAKVEIYANGAWGNLMYTLYAVDGYAIQVAADNANVRVGGMTGTNTVKYRIICR